jgi:hypothetical protein
MEQDALAYLCPLCGQPNLCQQVEQAKMTKQGCGTNACWCLTEKLDKETRQKLSIETDGKRCLCQSCMRQIA